MNRVFIIVSCFFLTAIAAQPPRLELQPNGFDPVEVSIPATPNEKLLELSENWAMEFNRRNDTDGYDISNVTPNSMTIGAFKERSFYYTNRGEAFDHKIKYEMRLIFDSDRYTVTFMVTDIYLDDNVRIEYTIPDYFTSRGKLKEGYEQLESSLEETVNNIVQSHYNFIIDFR